MFYYPIGEEGEIVFLLSITCWERLGHLIVTIFWPSKQHKPGFASIFFKIAGSLIITGEAFILQELYWGCDLFVTRKVLFCSCDRDLYKNNIFRIN